MKKIYFQLKKKEIKIRRIQDNIKEKEGRLERRMR